jgi:peroxiredoxin Q/BCP
LGKAGVWCCFPSHWLFHEAAMLNINDLAPDFTLPSDRGGDVSLSGLLRQGRSVTLYFYPKDDTPGCIIEGCAFRDRQSLFEQSGCLVFGISSDGLDSHKKFSAKYRFNYPLLSDTGGKVSETYGARALFGLVRKRLTYVIGPDGRVRLAFNNNADPEKHVDAALQALGLGKG